MRQAYARRKKILTALYVLMALLMLSLGLSSERWWQGSVFVLTAACVWTIFRINRCPKCKTLIPAKFTGACPHCGEQLE